MRGGGEKEGKEKRKRSMEGMEKQMVPAQRSQERPEIRKHSEASGKPSWQPAAESRECGCLTGDLAHGFGNGRLLKTREP